MKKRAAYILILLLLTLSLVGFSGHVAYAADAVNVGLCLTTGFGCMTEITAYIVNQALSIASWLVSISGMLLNFAMNLTLHIKDFVQNTQGVYTVWKAIRDISGIFIIFLLMYAAFRMILGYDAKMKQLITTVIVAGILINFSFFVTSIGIDLSNVVSLQLYNTIAPPNSLMGTTNGIQNPLTLQASTLTSLASGGIADVFMSALKVARIYDKNTGVIMPKSSVVTKVIDNITGDASLKIIFAGIVGVMIMLTTALSFTAVAIAVFVRFIVLIFLLGFSPICFAAFAIPQLKEYSTKWLRLYKDQLLFLPVYLLLTNFSLTVLTTTKLFDYNNGNLISVSQPWQNNFVALCINAVFVILMLDAPLIAAISMGAILPGWAKKVGAGAMWGKLGSWARGAGATVGGAASGFVGRNTIGRGASVLDKKFANTSLGNSALGRATRAATLGKAAAGKYGGSQSYADQQKLDREIEGKEREFARREDLDLLLAPRPAGSPPPLRNGVPIPSLDDTFGAMSKDEKMRLGADVIASNPEVLKRMKDKDFDAIKEATEGYSDEDKKKVAQARKDLLINSAKNGDHETVKKLLDNMSEDQWKSMKKDRIKALGDAAMNGHKEVVKNLMKEMDGKELRSLEDDATTAGLLTLPEVIEHYTESQLKKMSEEGLQGSRKSSIGNQIRAMSAGGTAHRANPFINRSPAHIAEWS